MSLRLGEGTQLDMNVGEARPGVPMGRDLLCNWMSSTKPVTVVAIAQLWERGKLKLDQPVAAYIPEFAAQGKQRVLVEHLLTHTAGVPYADASHWGELHKWDVCLKAICEARLADDWVPGRRCAYHTYSAWLLLGEIVQRIDGRPLPQYLREEIFEPLGMCDCHVGMDKDTYMEYANDGRIAELRTLSPMTMKVSATAAQGITANEVMGCVPGAGGRGPACEWLLFYEMMLKRGVGANGTRILDPGTVHKFTTPHRIGMFDEAQRVTIDWSLGFFCGGRAVSEHASAETFGHAGSQSSLCFCDPKHQLCFTFFANARPGAKLNRERLHALVTLVYDELGLVTPDSADKPPAVFLENGVLSAAKGTATNGAAHHQ